MKTADDRATAPLIPWSENWGPWFLAYPPLDGEQKWSEYEVKGLLYPAHPRGGVEDPRVSNNWCIILYGDFPKRWMIDMKKSTQET